MHIRSIRLLNIRSFGQGPDGTGVRVVFERGLNRLAGRNGSGKSTVIEALGYALFDAPPPLGQRLEIEQSLLRQGQTRGEIEVELVAGPATYLVARALGEMPEPKWSVRSEQGPPLATEPGAIRRLLAQAAGLDLPEELPDLFRKLLGVRQGRLLEPFECGPAEARRHFAPLLNTEKYQQCFNDLAAPLGALKDQLLETAHASTRARAQVELLAQAPVEGQVLAQRLERNEAGLERLRTALGQIRARLAALETGERVISRTGGILERSRQEIQHAEQALVAAREALLRAERAREVLEANARDYEACERAEQLLAELATGRTELESQQARTEELAREAALAQARAEEAGQRATQLKEELRLSGTGAAAGSLGPEEGLGAGGEAAERDPAGEDPALPESLLRVERWAASLEAAVGGVREAGAIARRAQAELADFDPDRIAQSRTARDQARQEYEKARERLTQAETRRGTRREMARELGGGQRCPLLAEKCRQFDSGKLVLSEVQLDEAVERVRNELAVAEAAHRRAEQSAELAEAQIEGSQKIRAQTDVALREIGRQVSLAADFTSRESFAHLGDSLPVPGQARFELPSVCGLPDPGADPWNALSTAPRTVADFCEFAALVAQAAQAWRRQLEQRREAATERRRLRELRGHELRLRQERAARQQEEQERLVARLREQEGLAAAAREEAQRLGGRLQELRERLTALREGQARAEKAEQLRQATREGHSRYLQARTDAERLEQARAEAALALGGLDRAKALAQQALEERSRAAQGCSPEEVARARAELLEASRGIAALEKEVDRDREALALAQRRRETLRQAQEEARQARTRQGLLEARIRLLEHARKTLREIGPRIAQELVAMAAARAQRLYVALSPEDPGQLVWEEDFEVCVVQAGGPRHFATLSGGQKIKVALALQIALVQQLSRAGLCIFDEPTAGLDAESRALLAQAVVEAQVTAGFEQLFIVSHDDAFDGQVEHTIRLEYSPLTGTTVL